MSRSGTKIDIGDLPLLALNLGCYVIDVDVGGLDIEGDDLSGKSPDKDLCEV